MIVACVLTGTKYPVQDVYRLQAMVQRHLPIDHRFVCITDKNSTAFPGIDTVRTNLPGWFGKLQLFEPTWRLGERVLYLDLDSVITGSLEPLAALDTQFGICANFTRRAGNLDWPCQYGSCVMTIGSNFGARVWERFRRASDNWMRNAERYGDQWIIEQLAPGATLLQDALPEGYFVGYRDLLSFSNAPPRDAAIIVFAGKTKPTDSPLRWVHEAREIREFI